MRPRARSSEKMRDPAVSIAWTKPGPATTHLIRASVGSCANVTTLPVCGVDGGEAVALVDEPEALHCRPRRRAGVRREGIPGTCQPRPRRAPPAFPSPPRLASLVLDRRSREQLGQRGDDHLPRVRALLEPRGDVHRVPRDEELPIVALAGRGLAVFTPTRAASPMRSSALSAGIASRIASAARTARSASPSCSRGTPETTVTASPMTSRPSRLGLGDRLHPLAVRPP